MKIRKITITGFLIPVVAVLLSAQLVSSWNGGPHDELNNPAKCVDCHEVQPEEMPAKVYMFKNLPIRDNVTEACTSCHEQEYRSHPTDIEAGFEVPPDLPLKDGKITCYTCHYPHGDYESNTQYLSTSALSRLGSLFSGKSKHKTSFLRKTNSKGQLCLTCHTK